MPGIKLSHRFLGHSLDFFRGYADGYNVGGIGGAEGIRGIVRISFFSGCWDGIFN